jgi:hypothetical protein
MRIIEKILAAPTEATTFFMMSLISILTIAFSIYYLVTSSFSENKKDYIGFCILTVLALVTMGIVGYGFFLNFII